MIPRPRQKQIKVHGISDKEIFCVRKSIEVIKPDDSEIGYMKRDYQKAGELLLLNTFIIDIARVRKKWRIPLNNDGPWNVTFSPNGEWRAYIKQPTDTSRKIIAEMMQQEAQSKEITNNEAHQWTKFITIYQDEFLQDIGAIIRKYHLAPKWLESIIGIIKDYHFIAPARLFPVTLFDPAGNPRHFVEISPDTQARELQDAIMLLRYKTYASLPGNHKTDHTAANYERNIWFWESKRKNNQTYGQILKAYKVKYPRDRRDDEQIKSHIIRTVKWMDKQMKKYQT